MVIWKKHVDLLPLIVFSDLQNESDRVLIYLTLFITECLKKLSKCANKPQALQEMVTLAISRFAIPGEPGFPLNAVYVKPSNPQEAGKNTFTHFRL